MGFNICYDGRHPGSSLAVAHLGAELILHPHGNFVGRYGRDPLDWTDKKRAYLGQRAMDTCAYELICNSVGDVRDRDGRVWKFSGGAVILGPDGEFAARSASARRNPHMVVADLDIEGLRRMRAGSFFRHRRPEVYVRALTGT